ncbi:MAG: hypothetical protein JWN88_1230 [Frankiales bacterium]|jgi:hypothetical protein|nr:hypothetical protein [Mycetocola sp.]MCW2714183.1 hypothetical protein [Frankiales bacterium]
MPDSVTVTLPSPSAAVSRIDPELAHQLVGQLSVGLGALAVLAPSTTARLFGITAGTTAAPLLVRMVGVRNATAGVRTLQAEGEDLSRALQAGLVLGAVDATAVLLAARKGLISKKAALGALTLLGGIAVLGVAAGRGTRR